MTDTERLARDLGVLADRLEERGLVGPSSMLRALAWMLDKGYDTIHGAIDGIDGEVGDGEFDPIPDRAREYFYRSSSGFVPGPAGTPK